MYEDAIALYDQAIKRNDDLPDLHNVIADIYYICEKIDEAIEHYVKSIKIEKTSKPEVYFILGNALSSKNRFEEAVKWYKDAIKQI